MTESARAWRGLDALIVSPTPTHPQDHGNRRRIHAICSALKNQGANVHFVHYPAEADWRHRRPAGPEAAMQAAWASYQLVAPSRPLHESAADLDHGIDEWADTSISSYLAWACRLRRYDFAIVNYTWMSFALEAIPKSVFKILDTHDVFGGRRALLEVNGVAAEFFHTTRDGEAAGLRRADLVWAIKDSERAYFQNELGVGDTLTMLHAERSRDLWRGPPSDDGWLRAGVIGARNNVNRRNLEAFLEAALPIFRRYMAPVKIVIAGGCSEDFARLRHPNVEVRGRLPDVDDFYKSVDVVIAPMQFSTGLKIKVSEALASGAPLVAHAHAMEGFPTREALHLLPSFEAMALRLAELSRDRAPLGALALQSRKVCDAVQIEASAALEATRAQVVDRIARRILIVAPVAALDPASLLHDHLHSAIDYIRFTTGIELFLVGPAAPPKFELLESYGLHHSVFVDPSLRAALGESAPESWAAAQLADLLAARGYSRAYLMADVKDALVLGHGRLRQLLVRHDAIEIAGGEPDALIERLRGDVEVLVIGATPATRRWEGAPGVSQTITAPFRRTGVSSRLALARRRAESPGVFVLARRDDRLADEVAALARRLGVSVARVDASDPETAWALVQAPAQGLDPLSGLADARLFVDMTAGGALPATLREAAARADVPCLIFMRGSSALAFQRFRTAGVAGTVGALLRGVAAAVADPAAHAQLREQTRRDLAARAGADAGWTLIWRLLSLSAEATPRADDPAPAARLVS